MRKVEINSDHQFGGLEPFKTVSEVPTKGEFPLHLWIRLRRSLLKRLPGCIGSLPENRKRTNFVRCLIRHGLGRDIRQRLTRLTCSQYHKFIAWLKDRLSFFSAEIVLSVPNVQNPAKREKARKRPGKKFLASRLYQRVKLKIKTVNYRDSHNAEYKHYVERRKEIYETSDGQQQFVPSAFDVKPPYWQNRYKTTYQIADDAMTELKFRVSHDTRGHKTDETKIWIQKEIPLLYSKVGEKFKFLNNDEDIISREMPRPVVNEPTSSIVPEAARTYYGIDTYRIGGFTKKVPIPPDIPEYVEKQADSAGIQQMLTMDNIIRPHLRVSPFSGKVLPRESAYDDTPVIHIPTPKLSGAPVWNKPVKSVFDDSDDD